MYKQSLRGSGRGTGQEQWCCGTCSMKFEQSSPSTIATPLTTCRKWQSFIFNKQLTHAATRHRAWEDKREWLKEPLRPFDCLSCYGFRRSPGTCPRQWAASTSSQCDRNGLSCILCCCKSNRLNNAAGTRSRAEQRQRSSGSSRKCGKNSSSSSSFEYSGGGKAISAVQRKQITKHENEARKRKATVTG